MNNIFKGVAEKSDVKYNGQLKGFRLYDNNGQHFKGYYWLNESTTAEDLTIIKGLKEHFPINCELYHEENKKIIEKHNIKVGQHYKNKYTEKIIKITHIHALYGWIIDDTGSNTLNTQTALQLITDFELLDENKKYFRDKLTGIVLSSEQIENQLRQLKNYGDFQGQTTEEHLNKYYEEIILN